MPWYAAHAVMLVEFKDGTQDLYPVWENVHLIEAPDGDAAHELAVARAKEDEHDSSSSLTYDDRPARHRFVGIRKLIAVSHASIRDELGSGDEVTYSRFDLPDLQALDRFVAGDSVDLKYVE